MQSLIDQLTAGGDLGAGQVERSVASLIDPAVDENAKAEFLRALRKKGESAAEIAAFVHALLARAIDPLIDPARVSGPIIDVCGTGGDRLEIFNVSTTSMFLLAAGGATVVKHGNRAITSKCGGADVLEFLGARIDLAQPQLCQCVETLGLGFIFAPAYHPAFKVIAPIRKRLAAEGVPTIFNLLGPLLNPARPAYQLVGIFDRTGLERYATVLKLLGRTKAWTLNSTGADEILPSGGTEVVEATPLGLRRFAIDPVALGIAPAEIGSLRGGGPEENARILTAILDGTDQGPKRDTVLLNAAAAFVVSGITPDLATGLALAQEQIASGRAIEKLHALVSFLP